MRIACTAVWLATCFISACKSWDWAWSVTDLTFFFPAQSYSSCRLHAGRRASVHVAPPHCLMRF